MRRQSDLIPLLISLLLILSCPNKAKEASNIVIEPAGDSIYAYGDSVNLKMTIYNNSDNDMVVYQWQFNSSMTASIGTWLDFEIIEDNGSTIEYNYWGPHPKMPYVDDTLHISPGASYSEIINISKYYGSGNRNDLTIIANNGNSVYFWRWPVGKYTISCVYEYKHNPNWIGGKDLWEGKLTSNEIQIEVK